MRKTPLKRSKPLNAMSLKKIQERNAEVPARIKLCKRAKGTPVISTRTIKLNDGTKHELITVRCINGICQCGCGERGELFPHEKKYRSHGGKLSLRNSMMVLNKHHGKLQNNEPIWSNVK